MCWVKMCLHLKHDHFSVGNADGSSPVLNLSKNTPEDVSDSDEAAADADYDSDNEPPNGNGNLRSKIKIKYECK